MTVYVDRAGHLAATDVEELQTFAKQIGLKKKWFQDHPKHPHYDLVKRGRGGYWPSTTMIAKAIAAGALLVESKELVKKCYRIND